MIKEYLEYLKDNPKGSWFKRKLYGWGWVPVTWQGWLITILYVLFVLIFASTVDETSSPQEIVFTCILPITLLTIMFIRICYKKGEKPKWQWGYKKENE